MITPEQWRETAITDGFLITFDKQSDTECISYCEGSGGKCHVLRSVAQCVLVTEKRGAEFWCPEGTERGGNSTAHQCINQ